MNLLGKIVRFKYEKNHIGFIFIYEKSTGFCWGVWSRNFPDLFKKIASVKIKPFTVEDLKADKKAYELKQKHQLTYARKDSIELAITGDRL